jgi:sodium/pantothenate symporter
MIGGFFGFIIPKFTNGLGITSFTNFFDPFFLGVVVSIVMAYIGNIGKTRTAEEIAFHEKLHVIPKSETLAADYKRDFVYGNLMVISGVLITIVFIFYWAIPFNS